MSKTNTGTCDTQAPFYSELVGYMGHSLGAGSTSGMRTDCPEGSQTSGDIT